jgi:putative hydrolase of HD superfamily
MNPRLIDTVLSLGKLSFLFGKVERAILYPDKTTVETDTDHTVMLGLVATAYAARMAPHLDIGRIAEFALIHDLVEAYAGDTPTFGLHAGDSLLKEKATREKEAFLQIERELGQELPYIPHMIHEYESLSSSEARFVKALDKCMPTIAHILNAGASFTDPSTFEPFKRKQSETLKATYAKDLPEVMELFDALTDRMVQTLKETSTETA